MDSHCPQGSHRMIINNFFVTNYPCYFCTNSQVLLFYMDIGKYIGKFLLKNKYCSLPGLGVFELKKASASTNSSQTEIDHPSYIITFSPIGSIDDTFASFIASHENVSISNASNNIKEYCTNVKEEVQKSGSFDIEHLGKVTQVNGKLTFKQSSDLDLSYAPAPLPVIDLKPAGAVETPPDYSYPPAQSSYARKNKNAWMKPVMVIVTLALLAGIGYFGYEYWKNNEASEDNLPQEPAVYPAPMVDSTSSRDSLLAPSDSLNTPSSDTLPSDSNQVVEPKPITGSGKLYTVVIMSTPVEAAAKTKAAKWANYGHSTNVVNRDGQFLVTLSTSHSSNDTTILIDSVRKFFNPKGQVYILK